MTEVSFPILGIDFFRFFKLHMDPCSTPLEDSAGRQLAGLVQPSPPTVMVGFAQPYFPSHCRASFIARAASAGADSSPSTALARAVADSNPSTTAASKGADCRPSTAAASAGAASTGADSSPSSAATTTILIRFPSWSEEVKRPRTTSCWQNFQTSFACPSFCC